MACTCHLPCLRGLPFDLELRAGRCRLAITVGFEQTGSQLQYKFTHD